MTFVKPDLDDLFGIVAFASLGLLMLMVFVIAGVALSGVELAAWFKPVAVSLAVALPVVFAVCVILSEVAR